jgi:hypothetical protein
MPTNLNYQQARRVRNSKWTDLFVDQLVDKGVVGAVGKTISLKTKAKIKGIKEKFDPLNIAKFMTFGSKIGPALYGKMMGRDQKDIDYFTGRLKHVRVAEQKAAKLKGTPTMPGGNMDGMNTQLGKIYGFLKQTHEDNVRNSELSKNKEESIQAEKERRHKELMDTLKRLTESMGGGVVTMQPIEKKDNIFERMKKMVEDFLKDFDITKYIPDIPWAKLLGVLRWFSGPIGLALLGLTSAVAFSQWLKGWVRENVANQNQLSPEKAAELLRGKGNAREIEKFGGRGALMDVAKTGHMKAQEILDRGDIIEINNAGGTEFLQQVVNRGAIDTSDLSQERDLSQYAEQGPARPTTGGTALASKQKAWDEKWSNVYDPSGKRLDKVQAEQTPEQKAALDQQQRNAPGVLKQQLSEPLKPVEMKEPAATKAEPTPVPPSAKVSALSSDNAELQLPVKQDQVAQSITNNVTKVDQSNGEREGLRPSQIAVRNDCDTFMDMIVNSTRIV